MEHLDSLQTQCLTKRSTRQVLDLLRPDENGKMQTVCSTEVFGVLRAIVPFRLTGANRDYLILGTDAGRIMIVEYVKVRSLSFMQR